MRRKKQPKKPKPRLPMPPPSQKHRNRKKDNQRLACRKWNKAAKKGSLDFCGVGC